MTEEEFKKLQHQQLESGRTLKSFLQEMSISYSTWIYWRRKYDGKAPVHELAPISISNFHHPTSFSCPDENVPTGATLPFVSQSFSRRSNSSLPRQTLVHKLPL